MQTAAATGQLKEFDTWGVPVRVSRDGQVKSRNSKPGAPTAAHEDDYACLMIAHSRPAGEDDGGTGNAVLLSLNRYSGEFKCMDRNQAGWNITAFNRPNQTDRYTRSTPDEIRKYHELAVRAGCSAAGLLCVISPHPLTVSNAPFAPPAAAAAAAAEATAWSYHGLGFIPLGGVWAVGDHYR